MKMNARTCPYLILLSGTPGTGKSTISKSLSKQNGWITFSLGDFIIEKKIFSSEVDDRDAKIIDTEIAAKEGVMEILDKFFTNEVIIVDSHYADIILDGFTELKDNLDFNCVKNYSQGEYVIGIVCRCHPTVLQDRLKKRNYSSSKVVENIQAEILSESTQNLIEVLQKEKIFEIDTTKHSVDELSNSILENFHRMIEEPNWSNELIQKVGITDWIMILNEEGTLNSFFREDYGEKFNIELNDIEENKSQGERDN
ncbi:MAG: hypothetical protein EU530_05675 [Promethearchaeota archaeon]|nr:MAG: hypothetical protein EU530_05675 [Candidatus Lokiarchaeota archaeon]